MVSEQVASFGGLLRRFREDRGLTQEDLAEKAGLTSKGIGALERGERQRPYLHTVQQLAEALALRDEEGAAFRAAARGYETVSPLVAPPVTMEAASAHPPHGLPVPLTPLIGRERELATVVRLLGGAIGPQRPQEQAAEAPVRLLTLTGPGGVGKTRLALAVVAQMSSAFADGAAMVALAAIREPGLVATAIAHALGVRDEGNRRLIESIGMALRDRRMLLLIDNFEQVVEAAPLVATLLTTCPHLTILVTSRAPLHLSGEQELPVPPLAVPDKGHLQEGAALAAYPAVALFVQRARLVKPNFALAETAAPAVAEICRRLDGLPLALELAAARIKVLPPSALLARLSGTDGHASLHLLTGGAQDLPTRLQTMRNAIAWSYDLLGAAEQALFRRMAVFAGGCTLESIAAVCGASGSPGPPDGGLDVLEGLTSLVDKSLVHESAGVSVADEPRFAILETIRDYGWECLETHGEAELLRRRHTIHFLALAEAAAPALMGPSQAEWLARLESEHDNLRAALRWTVESGAPELGWQLAGALWRFWRVRGYLGEGRRWLEETLAMPASANAATGGTAARARALNAAGVLADSQGDDRRAVECYEESLALRRTLGDKKGVADSLTNLGAVVVGQGDYARAAALHEESLVLRRELADSWGTAATLNNLGIVARNRGDYVQAAALYEESLALQQQLGDKRGSALSLTNLAAVALDQGNLECAADLAQRGIALFQELGDRWGMVLALNNQASVARRQGDLARAETLYGRSLALYRDVGPTGAIVEALEGFAAVLCTQGALPGAVRLFGAAASQREALSLPVPVADRGAHEGILAALRGGLDEATYAAQWREGRALTLEKAIDEAAGLR